MLASDLSSQLLLAMASARPERGAGTAENPFRAADGAQARRIISACQGDRGVSRRVCSAPVVYSEGEMELHGRKFWAVGMPPDRSTPVVLLLHTAVGPHDGPQAGEGAPAEEAKPCGLRSPKRPRFHRSQQRQRPPEARHNLLPSRQKQDNLACCANSGKEKGRTR